MRRRVIAMLMLALWFPILSYCQSVAALDVCKSIVEKAAHNVYLNTSSYDFYDSAYDNYCELDGSTKQQWLNSSAQISYLGIGAQGNEQGGTSSIDIKQFCHLYTSLRIQHNRTYTQNTEVVEKALQTTSDCVRFALSGNTVQHTFGTPSALTLSITAGSGNTVKISSLGHEPYVTCVGAGSSKEGNITYSVGTKHAVDANFGTYAIECTRTSVPQPDGGQFYEAASLSLTSSAGNYQVYWPQKTVEPEREAEKIAANITALQNQVSQLQARLNAIGTDSNDQARMTYTRGGYFVTHNTDQEKQGCPAGQFVSAIDINWANLGHNDSAVGDIGVYCRKIVP